MKSLPKPRFSIVIPCYNEESYIGDTLTSLMKQTYDGTYEIIVVDNNSTDSTSKTAQDLGVIVIQEKRPGVCWARQTGTMASRGEIVISTDADTVFAPDWLQKIDEIFKRNEQCVAAAGPCFYRSGPYWGKAYSRLLFSCVNRYAQFFGHPFYVTATNIAFKKAFWEGYDVHSPQGGDELSLLHQLKKQGKVTFAINNPVYTSARRLKRGLFYNIFITFFYYYLFGYYIDRMFKRTVIGSAPSYRFENDERGDISNLTYEANSDRVAYKTDG